MNEKYKCNKCGMCCKAICLSLSSFDIMKRIKPEGDCLFVKNNFYMITKKEALEINPFLKHWLKNKDRKHYFYKCKQFDDKNNKCLIHKNKPDICKDYPFYGRDKRKYSKYSFYTENCGYNYRKNYGKRIRNRNNQNNKIILERAKKSFFDKKCFSDAMISMYLIVKNKKEE